MKKLNILFLTMLIIPAIALNGWGAVSRTVSYTLTVTIPPHVQTVSVTPLEDKESIEETNRRNIFKHQDYIMEEIVRAEETILLRTFVVR